MVSVCVHFLSGGEDLILSTYMANWDKLQNRGDVQDRRGVARSTLARGGISGVLLLMGITYLMGGDPLQVLLQTDPAVFTQSSVPAEDSEQFAGADSYEVFASTVLGSNNEYWKKTFAAQNTPYAEPTLVLFRGETTSACGGATSVAGPHYCPYDTTVYLDETFFAELSERFGVATGDVAQAYVIGHEVGHHVQKLLGLLDTGTSQAASIQTELQADCFAGLWEGSLKNEGVFTTGEITEAMNAAAAVGDDAIQQATAGRVQPELWTHGSSAERVAAFTTGYESGDFKQCVSM